MPIKFAVAKLEDAPEALRSFYVQQGDKFVLDAEGAVPKDKLDEFRTNNIDLQRQLEKYKDVDPAKYRELLEIDRKIREKELLDAGKVDELVELRTSTMRETYETEKTKLTSDLTVANTRLEQLLIDNVVKTSAIKLGVIAEAVDDVVLRAKTMFRIENGQPVPKDADGKVIYGKDGSSPMSVDEWLTGLKTSARHLFLGSAGSGAGGGNRAGAPDMSKLTPAQKISLGLQQMGRP
jgi:hypothetical protein